jgi:hypothetical protein
VVFQRDSMTERTVALTFGTPSTPISATPQSCPDPPADYGGTHPYPSGTVRPSSASRFGDSNTGQAPVTHGLGR